jgi:hypothetical protein
MIWKDKCMFFCLADGSSRFSETPVPIYQTTCNHIPEDSYLKICTFLLDGIENIEFYLLRYNTMQSTESQPMLQALLQAVFLLGLFFSLTDGDNMFLQNAVNFQWTT